MRSTAIVQVLQQHLPGLLAVYVFGSRITGEATADSDLDLAVLVSGYADSQQLWQLANGEIADIAGCAVDLLDLRAASTVMQYQIITTGVCWWARGIEAAQFEMQALSEKTALDNARADLLADIQREGRVYGK